MRDTHDKLVIFIVVRSDFVSITLLLFC